MHQSGTHLPFLFLLIYFVVNTSFFSIFCISAVQAPTAAEWTYHWFQLLTVELVWTEFLPLRLDSFFSCPLILSIHLVQLAVKSDHCHCHSANRDRSKETKNTFTHKWPGVAWGGAPKTHGAWFWCVCVYALQFGCLLSAHPVIITFFLSTQANNNDHGPLVLVALCWRISLAYHTSFTVHA